MTTTLPAKTLDTMSKEELSLLLFLETEAVDYGGRVDTKHLKNNDVDILKQWNKEDFISFGRIFFN